MMDLPDVQDLQNICSPVYRCFPPQPTRCAICGNTSNEGCPFSSVASRAAWPPPVGEIVTSMDDPGFVGEEQ